MLAGCILLFHSSKTFQLQSLDLFFSFLTLANFPASFTFAYIEFKSFFFFLFSFLSFHLQGCVLFFFDLFWKFLPFQKFFLLFLYFNLCLFSILFTIFKLHHIGSSRHEPEADAFFMAQSDSATSKAIWKSLNRSVKYFLQYTEGAEDPVAKEVILRIKNSVSSIKSSKKVSQILSLRTVHSAKM